MPLHISLGAIRTIRRCIEESGENSWSPPISYRVVILLEHAGVEIRILPYSHAYPLGTSSQSAVMPVPCKTWSALIAPKCTALKVVPTDESHTSRLPLPW